MDNEIIVIPETRGSDLVLLSTFNNKHLSVKNRLLTLQVGTNNLKDESFTITTVRVLLDNKQTSVPVQLVSLQKTINNVIYYVTAQDNTDAIKLQQFSASPDAAHPDERLFILEPANTWCLLQSWKRKGFYLRSNQSTLTLEKRDDSKNFLFDFLPIKGETESCVDGPTNRMFRQLNKLSQV